MTPNQCYNNLLAEKLIRAFEKRNFEGFYCETKAEALEKIVELLPENTLVSCGGSATLQGIGLIDLLKNGSYVFLNPHEPEGASEKDAIAHQVLSSDYYFISANESPRRRRAHYEEG